MAYNRIHNKGTYNMRDELIAAGTITPGMLLEVTSAGKVQAHSTEGGRAERIVALEDALQGSTVDDDYSADDPVQIEVVAPGSVMNMLISAGEALNPGDEVFSYGDGTLAGENSINSAGVIEQAIGRIDASETAFTHLTAAALKAVRFV